MTQRQSLLCLLALACNGKSVPQTEDTGSAFSDCDQVELSEEWGRSQGALEDLTQTLKYAGSGSDTTAQNGLGGTASCDACIWSYSCDFSSAASTPANVWAAVWELDTNSLTLAMPLSDSGDGQYAATYSGNELAIDCAEASQINWICVAVYDDQSIGFSGSTNGLADAWTLEGKLDGKPRDFSVTASEPVDGAEVIALNVFTDAAWGPAAMTDTGDGLTWTVEMRDWEMQSATGQNLGILRDVLYGAILTLDGKTVGNTAGH